MNSQRVQIAKCMVDMPRRWRKSTMSPCSRSRLSAALRAAHEIVSHTVNHDARCLAKLTKFRRGFSSAPQSCHSESSLARRLVKTTAFCISVGPVTVTKLKAEIEAIIPDQGAPITVLDANSNVGALACAFTAAARVSWAIRLAKLSAVRCTGGW